VDLRLRPLRRAIALALVTLTGGMAAGVSVLDAYETVGEPGVEKSHDAARCSFQHDHSLCVVFQHTPAAATPSSPSPPLGSAEVHRAIPRTVLLLFGARLSDQPARAPPLLPLITR
jgi:hypothetical protein